MDDHEQYLRLLVARAALQQFNDLAPREKADLLEGVSLILPPSVTQDAEAAVDAFRQAAQRRSHLEMVISRGIQAANPQAESAHFSLNAAAPALDDEPEPSRP